MANKKKLLAYPAAAIFLGAFLGTILPAPTDIVHFGLILPWLQVNLNNPATRWQVAAVTTFDWYLLDSIWWGALLIFAVEFRPRLKTAIAVIVGGFVVGMLANFVWSGSFLPRPGL